MNSSSLGEVFDRADVGQAQGVAPRELASQMAADVAGGASDEDLFHASSSSECRDV